MNLKEIRTKFIDLSGRFDLVMDTINYVDNGANFYVQGGLKWLDTQSEVKGHFGIVYRLLEAGSPSVTFKNSKVVTDVFIVDTGLEKTVVNYLPYDKFMEEYPKLRNTEDTGTPEYWTKMPVRAVNKLEDTKINGYIDYMDLIDLSESYEGILLAPVPTVDCHLEVWGKFNADDLSEDEDYNWWTVNYPNIVIKAALRELDTFNHNTSGVNDWTNSLMMDLYGIEKDFVDADTYHISQMEG